MLARVVVQAQLADTQHGLVPNGEGWFVLNPREAQWWKRRVTVCDFEGEPRFGQLGINLTLLDPGVPMTAYHWDADQEDFLVLSGEAILVIEGEERTLRQWDFVPSRTRASLSVCETSYGEVTRRGRSIRAQGARRVRSRRRRRRRCR